MGTLPWSDFVSQVEITFPPLMSLIKYARKTGVKVAIRQMVLFSSTGTV